MPELPEVETIVRGLRERILNKKIKNIKTIYPGIVSGKLDLNKLLKGDSFKKLERHGKYLKFITKKGLRLVVHLRMTGQLFLADQKYQPDKHVHIIISFGRKTLIYRDIRKFGRWSIVAPKKEFAHYINAGVDALAITTKDLAELMTKSKKIKLKAFLLDQTKLAGVGNIYADEICYGLGVNPEIAVGKVDPTKLNQMLKKVLHQAIKHKGTSVSDYLTSEGAKGNFQNLLSVYQQKTCKKCQSKIIRKKVAGRSTHYCPVCQK